VEVGSAAIELLQLPQWTPDSTLIMPGSVSSLSSEYRLALINWFSLRLGGEMGNKGSGLAIVTGSFPEIRISYHLKTVLEDRVAKDNCCEFVE
jgi:hypothetical protein